MNCLAKTDRVDAEIGAEMGRVVPNLRPVTPQDTIRQERVDPLVLRGRLIDIRTSLKQTGMLIRQDIFGAPVPGLGRRRSESHMCVIRCSTRTLSCASWPTPMPHPPTIPVNRKSAWRRSRSRCPGASAPESTPMPGAGSQTPSTPWPPADKTLLLLSRSRSPERPLTSWHNTPQRRGEQIPQNLVCREFLLRNTRLFPVTGSNDSTDIWSTPAIAPMIPLHHSNVRMPTSDNHTMSITETFTSPSDQNHSLVRLGKSLFLVCQAHLWQRRQ